jgi:hypothetical protein
MFNLSKIFTDGTVKAWHRAIIKDAEKLLGRKLKRYELKFIKSRKGFIALEMIHDTIKAGTKTEIESYLASEYISNP